MRALLRSAAKSRKTWLLPIFLFLIIVALLLIAAGTAPPPVFIYPIR